MKFHISVLFFCTSVCNLANLCICVVDRYPSSYPFENEVYKIDTNLLPVRTPSKTYDKTDPGGYYRTVFTTDPFINQYVTGPYAPPYYSTHEPSYGLYYDDYAVFQLYGVSVTTFPISVFNCTTHDVFSQDNFNGIFYDKVVCTNCCSKLNYFGSHMLSSNFQSLSDNFGLFSLVGACGYPSEELYCLLLNGWTFLCNEVYLSPSKRGGPMMPCFDSMVVWMLTCVYFKSVGILDYMSWCEPPLYLELLDTLSQMYIYAIQYANPVRGCLPYSYFNPGFYEVGNQLGVSYSFKIYAIMLMLLFL